MYFATFSLNLPSTRLICNINLKFIAMKKPFLFIVAISFGLLSFSQDYAVLRLGSTDASTLTPGDTVLVPIYCDDISNSLILGWEFGFSFDESVFGYVSELMNVNPKFGGNLFENINYLGGGLIMFSANWIDPNFIGEPMDPGEKFFDVVFVYQGGETELVWGEGYGLSGPFNTTLIDGCICSPITFPAIFHVMDGDVPVEDASATINDDVQTTDSYGMTVFNLQNGEYSYLVSALNYDETVGSFSLDNTPQIIYVDLGPEELFPLMFNCEASCENDFNGWDLVINSEIIAPGETIYLPAGDWAYSVDWLDCQSTNGLLTITEPMEFDCGLIINPEPHVTFHVFSNEGDVQNVEVSVGPYTLMTDVYGEAGFCLPGGDFGYVVSKEGYGAITGVFSYDNYCEDTLVEVLLEPLKIGDNAIANFQIYPNPSNGQFLIDIANSPKTPIEVVVVDLTGRTIFRKTYDGISKINIDLSDKKKGLYFLQLKSGSLMFNSKLLFK